VALGRIAAVGSCRLGEGALTLKIAQDSNQTRPDYWKWSAWIDGAEEELDAIEQVTWLLHPTFVDPVRTSTSRSTNFRLETAGWGEFQLKTKVKLKAGNVQDLTHWVRLVRTLPVATKEHAATSKDEASPPRLSAFVSYTRENVVLMREITEALVDHGIDPSIDADVPSGAEFRRWVAERISMSDAVVALISDNIDVSQESEIKLGLKTKKPVFMISTAPLSPETMKLVRSYDLVNVSPFLDSKTSSTRIDYEASASKIEQILRASIK
jgi:galactokinase